MSKRYPHLLSERTHELSKRTFRSKTEYETALHDAQLNLLGLQQQLYRQGKKMVVLFEGPDAAGKGGVIKRLTQYLDPRGIRVHGIGKPNVIEQEEHYLERFFRALPQPGMITVFDRSWYGRILVERIEKLCTPEESSRAYEEINALEKALRADGILILKYVLDLTYKEQGRRFKEREQNPLKTWKLTSEDWRNRAKWNQYHSAYKDMLRRTSTPTCPWNTVAADSKWNARVSILKNIEARARRFHLSKN